MCERALHIDARVFTRDRDLWFANEERVHGPPAGFWLCRAARIDTRLELRDLCVERGMRASLASCRARLIA